MIPGAIVTLILYLLKYFHGRYICEEVLREPPGPPGVPILGNEFQIPSDKQWLRFHEWSKKYGTYLFLCFLMIVYEQSAEGKIVKFSTMGQPEIVIASAQIAFDLLDSRGKLDHYYVLSRCLE